MGLDITAYSKLKSTGRILTDDDDDDDYDYKTLFAAYINPDFPAHADGILNHALYEYADSYGFRAGSYGGYNLWRDTLARLAGSTADAYFKGHQGPFASLINFADNEGVINAYVSDLLAKDFAEYDERAKTFSDDWFYARYCDWHKAFKLAADGGCVDFH